MTLQWLREEGGADVSELNNQGYIALLLAARFGRLTLAQWLLEEGGADVGERNNAGEGL